MLGVSLDHSGAFCSLELVCLACDPSSYYWVGLAMCTLGPPKIVTTGDAPKGSFSQDASAYMVQ